MALDAQLYSDADVFVVIDAVAELGDRWSFPAAADQAQKRLQSASIGIIDYQNAVDIIREAAAASSNSSRRAISTSGKKTVFVVFRFASVATDCYHHYDYRTTTEHGQ